MLPLKGLWRGWCRKAIVFCRLGDPELGSLRSHDTQASSDQSGATLMANPPQECSDVSATPDTAEILEAEVYANVGAFASTPFPGCGGFR